MWYMFSHIFIFSDDIIILNLLLFEKGGGGESETRMTASILKQDLNTKRELKEINVFWEKNYFFHYFLDLVLF